jgi:alpha-L-arabinofuranosidase
VNATANENPIHITLDHLEKFDPLVNVITLSSGSSDDENSFEKPLAFIPEKSQQNIEGKDFIYAFKPWSLTIIRIKKMD